MIVIVEILHYDSFHQYVYSGCHNYVYIHAYTCIYMYIYMDARTKVKNAYSFISIPSIHLHGVMFNRRENTCLENYIFHNFPRYVICFT
jgi:hypothetical protein